MITPRSLSSSVFSSWLPSMLYPCLGLLKPTCIVLHFCTLNSIPQRSAQSVRPSSADCSLLLSSSFLIGAHRRHGQIFFFFLIKPVSRQIRYPVSCFQCTVPIVIFPGRSLFSASLIFPRTSVNSYLVQEQISLIVAAWSHYYSNSTNLQVGSCVIFILIGCICIQVALKRMTLRSCYFIRYHQKSLICYNLEIFKPT